MQAILVDDEQLALDLLKRKIKKGSEIDIVQTFNNFNLDENRILLNKIDIVFLDIEMPGMNGIELAERLLEINFTFSIIFVTAFNDYAVKALELNALDYVLKPAQTDRLEQTIERVNQSFKNKLDKPLAMDDQLHINVFKELTFKLPDDNYEAVY